MIGGDGLYTKYTMSYLEIILIAVSLSMDAFAVSISQGMSVKNQRLKFSLISGCYFGGFQAGMPFLGYYLGFQFQNTIRQFDHWIAFFLLVGLGINMLKEASSRTSQQIISHRAADMIKLSIATSIDALAVGITFASLDVQIAPASFLIGATTFLFAFCGVFAGKSFGDRFGAKADIIGGIILILIGLKILIEHLYLGC